MSFNLPKAYGGVCLLVSAITGNCFIMGEFERVQREYYFNQDFMDDRFNEQH